MSKKLLLFFGLIFVILVPVWVFLVSPQLLKLPSPISYKVNMIHAENNRFDIDSQWIGKTIAISSSEVKTFASTSDKSTIHSLFKVESLTGEILFELSQSFLVDRQTRHNLPGEFDKDGKSSIFFPSNVSHRDINYWPVEMGAPSLLKYVGTKEIQKLNTYHFSASEAIIDDTNGYEFLPLVPEKYKVNSRIDIDIYVEPTTGLIIDYEDVGTSFYVDKDNKPVWDIAQWSNKYNDSTIADRIKEAKSTKNKIIIVSEVIPVLCAAIGIILAAIAIKTNNKNISSKKKK